MELQEHFINGRMDKDSDIKLIGEGNYLHAENIRVNSIDDGAVGVVENETGNSLVVKARYNGNDLSENAKTIGRFSNDRDSVIYWFINDPGVVDMVVSYNTKSYNMIYHLVSETILAFDQDYLITGIGMVDDILLWTDGLNPPRRINVNNDYSDFTAEDILVIVSPPTASPSIELIDAGTDVNYLKDKFVSFSYRYKYKDGEYSALSQFSNEAFAPSVFVLDQESYANKGMTNVFNAVDVTFNTGGKNVVGVDLCYKLSGSNIINVIDKYDKVTLGWSDNQNKIIRFDNSKIYTTLPSSELLRVYDNVPLTASAQTIIGNRVLYGGYVDGYDIKDSNGNDINIDFSAELESKEIAITALETTLGDGVAYQIEADIAEVIADTTVTMDLVGLDLSYGAQLVVTLGIDFVKWQGGLTTPSENMTNFGITSTFDMKRNYSSVYDMATSDEFISFVSAFEPNPLLVTENDNGSITDNINKNLPSITGYEPNNFGITALGQGCRVVSSEGSTIVSIQIQSLQYVKTDDPLDTPFMYLRISSPGIIYNKNGATESLHSNRGYEIGIIYMDGHGRSTTVLPSSDNTVNVPASNSTYQNSIRVTIRSEAPYWADRFKFAIKPSEGDYQTIYSNIFYREEQTNTTWFRLEGDNINKTSKGDILYVKSDVNGPVERNVTFTVLELEAKTKDFITETGTDGLEELAGTYIQANPQTFSADIIDGKIVDHGNITDKTKRNGRSQALVSYPCQDFIVAPATTANDYTVPRGSIVEFHMNFMRNSNILGCNKQTYTYNAKYVASRDFVNLAAFCQGESIDFSIGSGNMENHKYLQNEAVGSLYGIYDSKEDIPIEPGSFQGQYAFYRDADNLLKFMVTSNVPVCNGIGARYPSVTVRIVVYDGSDIMVFETTPESIDDGLFYEGNQSFNIEAGLHEGNISNQTSILPAVIDLNFNDCFVFGNGVESNKIGDLSTGMAVSLGDRTVAASQQDYKEANRYASLTYSGVYNEETNINKLNEFNLGLVNYKDLEKSFGRIKKLHTRQSDLMAFQENKVSYVLFGKNLMSDASVGNILTSVPEVLGNQIPITEEIGISENPESFAVYGRDIYFTDARRGNVVKMSNDAGVSGAVLISDIGMSKWFRDSMIENLYKQKVGAYDPYTDEYVLSFTDNDIPVKINEFDCGIEIVRKAQTEPFSFILNLNKLIGTSAIVYDIDDAPAGYTFNISVDYNGVVTEEIGISSSVGQVDFIKDSLADNTATVTITPHVAMDYRIKGKCVQSDSIRIFRVVLGSPTEGGLTSKLFHWWNNAEYTSQKYSVAFVIKGEESLFDMTEGVSSLGAFPAGSCDLTWGVRNGTADTLQFEYPGNTFWWDVVSGSSQPVIKTLTELKTDMVEAGPIVDESYVKKAYNNTDDYQDIYLVYDFRKTASIILNYSVDNLQDAACAGTPQQLYIDAETFSEATTIYTSDPKLIATAPDGFWANQGDPNNIIVRELVNGVLGPVIPFGSCTLVLDFTGSVITVDRASACSAPTTTTYWKEGEIGGVEDVYRGDIIYTSDSKLDVAGTGYIKVGDFSMDITDGVVGQKQFCSP